MSRFQQKSDEHGILPASFEHDKTLPPNMRKPSRLKLDGSGEYEKGFVVKQEGTFAFGRKKKHGCKLASLANVTYGDKQTQRKHKIKGCRMVFPKIRLDASDLTV